MHHAAGRVDETRFHRPAPLFVEVDTREARQMEAGARLGAWRLLHVRDFSVRGLEATKH